MRVHLSVCVCMRAACVCFLPACVPVCACVRPCVCVLPADEACSNCSFGAICDSQTGECVCSTECVESNQHVCGSDGATYDSECALHVRACKEQLDLRVVNQGDCGECHTYPACVCDCVCVCLCVCGCQLLPVNHGGAYLSMPPAPCNMCVSVWVCVVE